MVVLAQDEVKRRANSKLLKNTEGAGSSILVDEVISTKHKSNLKPS